MPWRRRYWLPPIHSRPSVIRLLKLPASHTWHTAQHKKPSKESMPPPDRCWYKWPGQDLFRDYSVPAAANQHAVDIAPGRWATRTGLRSEERRVGKEGGSRKEANQRRENE